MSLLQAEMQLVQHEENMLDIRKQAYDEEQSRRTDLKNANRAVSRAIECMGALLFIEKSGQGEGYFYDGLES